MVVNWGIICTFAARKARVRTHTCKLLNKNINKKLIKNAYNSTISKKRKKGAR